MSQTRTARKVRTCFICARDSRWILGPIKNADGKLTYCNCDVCGKPSACSDAWWDSVPAAPTDTVGRPTSSRLRWLIPYLICAALTLALLITLTALVHERSGSRLSVTHGLFN